MEPNARTETGNAIRVALRAFEAGSLRDRAEDLLRTLGYESERYEADFDFGSAGFLEWADEEASGRRIAKRPRDLILENWTRIQMVFQYTSDELAPQVSLFETDRSG